MKTPILALASVLLLLAACSGDGADETTTTVSTVTSTTGSPDTTNPAPATTSTSPVTTSTGAGLDPEGSGCTPGTEDLPDGLWYGVADSIDADGIGFDLACWFSGDAASAAAAEDGEESPPPNDYYVRNQNTQVRELPVDGATTVTWYPSGDPNDDVTGTFEDWAVFLDERGFTLGVWVTVEDGVVSGIEEQWVP
jgi:hypothetical protein